MKNKVIIKLLACLSAGIMLLTGCSQSTKTEYYKNTDFVSEDGKTIFETTDKNLGWGKYQKNESDLGENVIELEAGYIALSQSKEDFDKKVEAFRDRLDVLESEYALGYRTEEGDVITIKMDDSKLGLPVFALLNVNSPLDVMVVSQLRELQIADIRNIDYKVSSNSKYEVTVEIPENKQSALAEFTKEHIGETLYLKIGDLTFSSTTITETTADNKLIFEGFSFLGSNANEINYEFIMKLAEYVVDNPCDGDFTMSFPKEVEDEVSYKVPYITQMDEFIIATVSGLYNDTKFTREGIENSIKFYFEIDPNTTSVISCLNRIYRIYDECNFEEGAYSRVSFAWPSGKTGYNDYVSFSKKNGKMVCTNYSDRIKKEVEQDSFISRYIEK